jgi:hypothetical protein
MILSSSWRIRQLIDRRSDRKHRLQTLNIEIGDIKAYAQNIADGNISIGEMMKTPTSMYQRQLLYMNTASAYAGATAQTQMQQLMSSPNYQALLSKQDPQVQQAYNYMMQESFYKQAQQQFTKYESSLLHEKERAMEEEKQMITEELTAIEGELQAERQECSQSIKDFFGNNNRG